MSSDLVAAITAITFGLIVIVVGLRRNLADVTQSWLPRSGEASRQTTATLGLYGGGQKRQALSRWQKRSLVGLYLVLSALNAARAVAEVDDRLLHTIGAVVFAVAAVVFALRDRR